MIRSNKNMTLAAILALASVTCFHSWKKGTLTANGASFSTVAQSRVLNVQPVARLVSESVSVSISSGSSGSSHACGGFYKFYDDLIGSKEISHTTSCGGYGEKVVYLDAIPMILAQDSLRGALINTESVLKVQTYGPEIRPMNFKLFPNPMTTECRIEIGDYNNEPFQFELYDLSGKLLKRESNISNSVYIIPRNDLPSGIYIYRMLATDNVPLNTGKIVVE